MAGMIDQVKATLGNPIAYYSALVPIAGSVPGAVWLSQLIYWSQRGSSQHGWVYKTQSEWMRETAVGRSSQEAVRQLLRNRGILQEELRGLPATVHYRLDVGKLLEVIGNPVRENSSSLDASKTAAYRQSGSRRQGKQLSGSVAARFGDRPQASTQSVAKTTQRDEREELALALLEELGFSNFNTPIQSAFLDVWRTAGCNSRQDTARDVMHLRRARDTVESAVNRGLDDSTIVAAVREAEWPSKIVAALKQLVDQHDMQRRDELLKASREADLSAVGRKNREARAWFDSLSDRQRAELENEFCSARSHAFVQRFRTNPNDILCRAEFDKWLVARCAERGGA